MAETVPRTFSALLKSSSKPVLVDFYADWCGPCRMVSPAIAQIAKELKGKITTVKINVDKKPAIAGKYQVQSIPTIMLFRGSESIMRLQGALPYERLKAEIERALGS